MSILPDIEMDMDIDDGGPAPTPTRLLPLPASLREPNSTNKQPPASGGESESSSSHFVESEESPFKISNVTGDTEKSSEKTVDEDHEKSNGQSQATENESKVIKQVFFCCPKSIQFLAKKMRVGISTLKQWPR